MLLFPYLSLLAMVAVVVVQGLYFDCHTRKSSEDCLVNEYCVWDLETKICGLSAHSYYLLCLEDMSIPEELCLPNTNVLCHRTLDETFCRLQTPCDWDAEAQSCVPMVFEESTYPPTEAPELPEHFSRKNRVQCCAHSWRVCFPNKKFAAASQQAKDREIAKAKRSCKLDLEQSTMHELCVDTRELLSCPMTKRD